MKLIRFVKSKTFILNIILLLILGVAIGFLVDSYLESYTKHNKTIIVPNLSGLSIEEASQVLDSLKLGYEVIDSSEFNVKVIPGGIVDQYPEKLSLVKEDREIKLTVNPLTPRKVALPDFTDRTKRRAIYDLESMGLVVGELIYQPNLAKDVVLDIKIDGQSVQPGTLIAKGTTIDLILGQGLSYEKVNVPYVIELSLEEAKEKILASSMNLGVVLYDDDVVDSTTAFVYKQNPYASKTPNGFLGGSVDLWLTESQNKINHDTLFYRVPTDSVK